MDLHFIGRGSGFNTKEKNTSAYFVEGKRLFLIDCGESVFASLMDNNIFSKIQHVYVLISHTHSDHCGSLGTLGFYCQYVLHTKLNIVVPHNDGYVQSLKTLMSLYGNTSEAYQFVFEEDIDNAFKAFSSVRYELTDHDSGLTCFSFVFETSNGAVFYSADTRTSDNMLRFINQHDRVDRIYMEVTDIKIIGDVHLYIEDLKEVVPFTMRSKVWLIHLRSDDCIRIAKEAGFQIVSCYTSTNNELID